MSSFLLLLIACFGVVNANIDKFFRTSTSLSESSQKMKVQSAYPSYPSNPTYVTYKQFTDVTCTQFGFVVSYLEDTCLAGNDASSKFTCVNGAITRTTYSDIDCSVEVETIPYTTSADGCSFLGTQTVACGSSVSDYGSGDYFMLINNQDSSCTQPLVATGFLNNYCYTDASNSTKFAYPYSYQYLTPDCTGTSEVSEIDDTVCQFTTGVDDDGDDDDDDFAKDNTYQSFSHYVGKNGKQDKLSAGAIAGIVIGGTVFLIIIVVLVLWLSGVGCSAAVKTQPKAQQEMSGNV